MSGTRKYTNQELINELQRAEEIVDGVMSSVDYDKVGKMSRGTIIRRFGSWNEAKKSAGLEYNDYPQLKGRGMEYARELRRIRNCQRCGFSRAGALTFHHKEPAEKEVSPMDDIAMERTIKELEKCILLCSNCHNLHHSTESDVDVNHIEVPDWPGPDEVLGAFE